MRNRRFLCLEYWSPRHKGGKWLTWWRKYQTEEQREAAMKSLNQNYAGIKWRFRKKEE